MPALSDHVFFKNFYLSLRALCMKKGLDTRMVKLRLFEAIACET